MTTSYRRTAVRLVFTMLAVIMALVVFYDGWIADNEGDAYTGVGRQLTDLPFLLAFVLLAVRAYRMGIWTDRDGVLVRNLIRRYRFPWTSVASIQSPTPWPQRRWGGLIFVLSDGGQIPATLFSSSVFNRPGWGDGLVAELWSQRQRSVSE